MRICFISRRFFPAISGMSVYAINLLRELVKAGHDVTMISQFRGDEAGTRVYGGGPPPAVEGVQVIGLEALGEQRSPASFEADVETMVQTALREHERQPFDLFHAQYGYPTGLAALELSRRTGKPNVVSVQGGDGHWVGLCCATHKEAITTVFDSAGALLIGSKSFAAEVEEHHGTPLSRFTIVPGAVDATRFVPRDGLKLGELRDADAPVLLYHGRVDRRKGALDLLDAFALLRRNPKWNNARVVYSGIGPDFDAVNQKIGELNLSENVDVLGYVEYGDVPAIYHRGDVFLSPTYAEGFSNTILEAMASGLPVVSCHAVGVVDCLTDAVNGLLVQPGDVPALAKAIERILQDDALRTRLTQAAYEDAHEKYSWPVVGRQIMGVYDEIVGTAPDNSWELTEPVDLGCRFRQSPHLL